MVANDADKTMWKEVDGSDLAIVTARKNNVVSDC